jgi:hypothetical protein
MASNTLQGTSWIIAHETSGSRGLLSLGSDTKGTYSVGGNSSPIVWGEMWNQGNCALWVIFKNHIDNNVIRVWGMNLTMQGGTGVSADGNANPLDPNNTTFMNDNLTVSLPQTSN